MIILLACSSFQEEYSQSKEQKFVSVSKISIHKKTTTPHCCSEKVCSLTFYIFNVKFIVLGLCY